MYRTWVNVPHLGKAIPRFKFVSFLSLLGNFVIRKLVEITPVPAAIGNYNWYSLFPSSITHFRLISANKSSLFGDLDPQPLCERVPSLMCAQAIAHLLSKLSKGVLSDGLLYHQNMKHILPNSTHCMSPTWSSPGDERHFPPFPTASFYACWSFSKRTSKQWGNSHRLKCNGTLTVSLVEAFPFGNQDL